jgi:hypothetical protein
MVCRILSFSCNNLEFAERIKEQVKKDLSCLSFTLQDKIQTEYFSTFRRNLRMDTEPSILLVAMCHCWNFNEYKEEEKESVFDKKKYDFKVQCVLMEMEVERRTYCHCEFFLKKLMSS